MTVVRTSVLQNMTQVHDRSSRKGSKSPRRRLSKLAIVNASLWVVITLASITDPLRVLVAVLSRLQPTLGERKWDGFTDYTLPSDYKTNTTNVVHLDIGIVDGIFDGGSLKIYWPRASFEKKEHVYVFVGEVTAPNGSVYPFPDVMCLSQWSATEVVRINEVDLTSEHMLDLEWFPCLIEARNDGTFVPVQQYVMAEHMCREVALWILHDYSRAWVELYVPDPTDRYKVLALTQSKQQRKTARQPRYPRSTYRLGGGGAMINSKLFMNQKYLVFEEAQVQRCTPPVIWKDGHLRQFVDARANLSLIVDGYFELAVRVFIYGLIAYIRTTRVYMPLYRYVCVHGFPFNGAFDPIHAGLRYGQEIFLLALEALLSLDESIGTFLMLHESRTATYLEYLWLCSQASKILWIPIACVAFAAIIVRVVTGGRMHFRVSPDAYPLLVPFLVFYAGPRIVDSTTDLFQHYHMTTAGLGHISNSAKSSLGGVRSFVGLLHIVSTVLWPCTLLLFVVSVLQQASGFYLFLSGYRGKNHNLRHVTTRTAIGHTLMLHEHAVGPDQRTQSLGLVLYGYERALIEGLYVPVLVHHSQPIIVMDRSTVEKERSADRPMLSVIAVVDDKMFYHPLNLNHTRLHVQAILPLHWEYTSVPPNEPATVVNVAQPRGSWMPQPSPAHRNLVTTENGESPRTRRSYVALGEGIDAPGQVDDIDAH
ncbi:hypothetical protein Poli38472_014373 [Pythium oligandrum]|uniref:Transmembrane protein n=1 Tax=Pythium oligandrum TaxID=41045 RepID=A0A8K1C7L1_PYTOL|nr:hypothetical protein Poli38472_014373 [Pythium oligandrum]|eukprot:TMW57770.1 hypothetical protein Poli38472_014373 [Pythium oligandrum]